MNCCSNTHYDIEAIKQLKDKNIYGSFSFGNISSNPLFSYGPYSAVLPNGTSIDCNILAEVSKHKNSRIKLKVMDEL